MTAWGCSYAGRRIGSKLLSDGCFTLGFLFRNPSCEARLNVGPWGPAARHLMLSGTSISRSQTGCRALDHLSPCLTPPPPRTPPPLLPPPSLAPCASFPPFHPAASLPYLYICFLSIFHSLFGLPLFFVSLSPGHHRSLPPSHGPASKTAAGSWEAINQLKLAIRSCRATADAFLEQSLGPKSRRCSINAPSLQREKLTSKIEYTAVESEYWGKSDWHTPNWPPAVKSDRTVAVNTQDDRIMIHFLTGITGT